MREPEARSRRACPEVKPKESRGCLDRPCSLREFSRFTPCPKSLSAGCPIRATSASGDLLSLLEGIIDAHSTIWSFALANSHKEVPRLIQPEEPAARLIPRPLLPLHKPSQFRYNH